MLIPIILNFFVFFKILIIRTLKIPPETEYKKAEKPENKRLDKKVLISIIPQDMGVVKRYSDVKITMFEIPTFAP